MNRIAIAKIALLLTKCKCNELGRSATPSFGDSNQY